MTLNKKVVIMKNKFLVFSFILTTLLMASCALNNEGEEASTTTAEIITSTDATITSPKITTEDTSVETTVTTTEATTTTATTTEVTTTVAATTEATTTVATTTAHSETTATTITETEKITTASETTSTETEEEEPEFVELKEENNGTNDELNPTFRKMQDKNIGYYRKMLNKEEGDIYDAIFKFYSNPAKFVTVKNPYGPADDSREAMKMYEEKLFKIVTFVWIDNPFISQDLSNAMQFGYLKSTNKFVFIGGGKQTADIKAVIDDYQGYLDRVEQAYNKAEEISRAMPVDISTQKDMALYFHDYLINNATANIHGKENIYLNDEAYGPLILGTGTCEGFTNAFSMLCHTKGIQSVGVMYNGKTQKDIGHIWNLVRLDGVYTQIDVFHDNVVYTNGKEDIRYDYFGMSDSEIADKLAKSGKNQIDPMIAEIIPECHDIPIDK